MCGIAGYRLGRPLAPTVLERMVAVLSHRGPDAAGYHANGSFSGGMRRLSINDIRGGDQPLFNGDRSVVLFYNGEIYNSPELRRELAGKGYQFRTSCDGEVICHLYDEHGMHAFERLDGMFAAALWIARERRLILARDLPGEKPLYFARLSDSEVAYASEIKSLALFPGVDLNLDLQALWDFPTFLWIPEPDTVYRGIKALPPGHMLIADDSGIRVRPYANRFDAGLSDSAEEETVLSEIRRVVTAAVESRLLSDVPLGSFLSGGLDSSIVAAIARARLDRLATFSVGFEDLADPYHGRHDESEAAADYARRLGTDHHAMRVTEETFRQLLPQFCRHGDQPFAVSSGLGILAVARAAHEQGIKVLLSGDGADETFGGYSWYAHLGETPPPKRLPPNADTVSYQNFGMDLPTRLATLSAYPGPMRAWAWHYYASEAEKRRLFAAEPFADVVSSLRHFAAFKEDACWDAEDFIRQDRGFYLPNEMLRKLDRMTMAWSVEGRAPFVAPAVTSLAGRLPFRHLVRGGTLKWALRRAFADVLPAAVAARPKHGFNVPIDHWLKGAWADLVEDAFAAGSALHRLGLVAPAAGAEARRMLEDPVRLNGHTIFCYIMLNMWLEQERHGDHRRDRAEP